MRRPELSPRDESGEHTIAESTTPHYRWLSDRLSQASPDPMQRPRLLLLCDYELANAATVLDHVEAIRRWSSADVYVLPMRGDIPDQLDLEAFDGLVIHYNLVMAGDAYLSPLARWRIRGASGTKAAFIQDEYRFVNKTLSVMRLLRIEVLFTVVPEDQVPLVYSSDNLPQLRRVITVLTGYVPADLLEHPILPYDARPIDVGYRARRLPPWLGDHGRAKALIADRFVADAPGWGLSVDISCREEDRIYGDAWLEFIARSKAMLGNESGASIFDWDGSVEAGVRTHLLANPSATYEELHDRYMDEVEGNVRFRMISPRCFEAAALGTLMILYPGHYSGVLQPWQHYVPLLEDHSNMAEVVAVLRDQRRWQEITDRARAEVAENPRWSFKAMVEIVDAALELSAVPRPIVSPEQFCAIADQSAAAIAAGPAVRRRDSESLLARARRRLEPHPTVIALLPTHDTRRLAGARRSIQYVRAAAWWLLRPVGVPPTALLRGGKALLDDLGQLRLLQETGARAIATGQGSPYRVEPGPDGIGLEIRVDAGAAATLAASRPEAGAVSTDGRHRQDAIPAPRIAASVSLDLASPFLVPQGIQRTTGRLAAFSAFLRRHPEQAGRVLRGERAWAEWTGGRRQDSRPE